MFILEEIIKILVIFAVEKWMVKKKDNVVYRYKKVNKLQIKMYIMNNNELQ